jgi:hypothetical protein
LGKADASGVGENAQSKVIDRWIESTWSHLAKVLAEKPVSNGRLQRAQDDTVELCLKINPDFVKHNPELDDCKAKHSFAAFFFAPMIRSAVFFALLACAAYYIFLK